MLAPRHYKEMNEMPVGSSAPRRRRITRFMLWFSVAFGSFLLGIIFTVVLGTRASSQRPRYVKAAADARAMALAIRVYVQHCGGLPAGDTEDCPVAAEA